MKSLFLTVALLLPLLLAAPVDEEEMVTAPGGRRPKSSLVPIPEGGSINVSGNEVHVLDASKNIVHVAQRDTVSPPEASGWIAYANVYNTGSPISSLTSTWSVPPFPQTPNHGQLLYLFNSIVPQASGAILQPVLQFGVSPAGGGEYWSVSNWFLDSSGTYFTPLVNVSVGQTLEGVITLTSHTSTAYNYTSSFAGIPNEIVVTNTPLVLVWATETLETYGVTTGTDYPTGSTIFSNINLQTIAGIPSVSWSVVNDVADGLYATVLRDGATNAEIEITY